MVYCGGLFKSKVIAFLVEVNIFPSLVFLLCLLLYYYFYFLLLMFLF